MFNIKIKSIFKKYNNNNHTNALINYNLDSQKNIIKEQSNRTISVKN